MTGLACRLRCFLFRALNRWRTWPLEWYLAGMAVWTGAFVLAASTPYSVGPLTGLPTWGLGALLCTHGGASLWALLTKRTDLCRRSALVSFGLWLGIGVLIWRGPVDSPLACSLALSPAGASAWVYLRLAWIVEGGRWLP